MSKTSDITLLTCNYNTPTVTLNMLKSLKKNGGLAPEILVINTSTEYESEKILCENNIPYLNLKGGTHGEGVNFGLDNIQTKYVLLVDTDILFLKDITPIFDRFKRDGYTLLGNVVGDCAGKSLYPRVEPWFCLIDLDVLKENNIIFFDIERSRKQPDLKCRIYDVGSSMFEDVIQKNLTVGNVNLEMKYFKHYGGMSWRVQKYNPTEKDTDIDFGGTHNNRSLYEYGLNIREKYMEDIKNL